MLWSGLLTCCYWFFWYICFSSWVDSKIHACSCSKGIVISISLFFHPDWLFDHDIWLCNHQISILLFLYDLILLFIINLQLSQRTLSGSLLKYLSKLQVKFSLFGDTVSTIIIYYWCYILFSSIQHVHLLPLLIFALTMVFLFIFESWHLFSIMMQVDEEAAIRTNTTILLGNIASHLNEGVSKPFCILSHHKHAWYYCLRYSICSI